MLHTYGNSKPEGRKLCFQKHGTAGQDYSLTHRGQLGRGNEHLWQPLFREGMKCQSEASARSSAGYHTSFSLQPMGAREEWGSFSKWDSCGCLMVLLYGLPAWDGCCLAGMLRITRFPPHLIPLAFPLGIRVSWYGLSMPCLDVGAGSSYVWTPACGHPRGCIKPSRTVFVPACRAILSLNS